MRMLINLRLFCDVSLFRNVNLYRLGIREFLLGVAKCFRLRGVVAQSLQILGKVYCQHPVLTNCPRGLSENSQRGFSKTSSSGFLWLYACRT